jgi:O-glycosyl hydrolase
MRSSLRSLCVALIATLAASTTAHAQTVTIDTTTRYQTIDGFGTMTGSDESQQAWWQQLFFDDLQASIFRVDIEPTFTAAFLFGLRMQHRRRGERGARIAGAVALAHPAPPSGSLGPIPQ